MSIKVTLAAATAAMLAMSGAAASVQADSIGEVENARAKDRAGYYTSRQDREKLRRYGRNDDGYSSYSEPYYGDSYGGGGVSVYVGPRHRYGYDD
jgi:hypothetical protein